MKFITTKSTNVKRKEELHNHLSHPPADVIIFLLVIIARKLDCEIEGMTARVKERQLVIQTSLSETGSEVVMPDMMRSEVVKTEMMGSEVGERSGDARRDTNLTV